ncbi:MAG: TonB-dependent receptor [Myxococcales bacterium]
MVRTWGRALGGAPWIRFALALALLWCPSPRAARADGVADEAEVNFRLGAERYQAGDYRGALAYFLASNRLAPNHYVRFNVARAFQRLGQYPEAYRWCEAALEGDIEPTLRAQLQETLAAIEREVAVVELTTDPAGATVFMDRRNLGSVAVSPARLALPPGKHRILVELAGYEAAQSEELSLERGSRMQLGFQLKRIVGAVEVRAEAPTQVWSETVEGPPACTTPCALQLPPGTHMLHFRREGYQTPPAQVHVRANQSSQVHVEASPLTGSVLVTSVEREALIQIDGVSVGFTPSVVRNIAVGERVVRVSAPGFEPAEHHVFVQQGVPAELKEVALSPSRKVTAAARSTQSIDEAPASVSVISQQELAAFRYPTIYEALRGQRGVTLSNDGVYAGIALRGLGQPGDYGNRMLVLSDGATLNDNILWQSFVGYDGRVDLGDVAGIELVRGPGSVLYGTGAVSGVVNLIPRGRPERPGAELQVAAQDKSTARGRVAGAVPFGTKGGLRLSASAARGGGEDAILPTQPLPTAISGLRAFDAATGNARMTYGAFTFQGLLTTRKQFLPNGAYGAVVGAKPNDLQDTRGMLEVRFEPRIGRRLQLFTRAYGNTYDYRSKQVYPNDPDPGTFVADERYVGRWFGAEARLAAELTPQLKLAFGAEVSASTSASLRGTSIVNGARESYLKVNTPYQLYAGYVLAEWHVARWLTASAGGRVDSWSTFGATVNPRLALLFRLSERDNLKLMGGRAFRAPSIYELKYNDGGVTQVPSNYRGYKLMPELVWSGELEYAHRFVDGWSLITAGHAQYAEALIEQTAIAPEADDEGDVVRYKNRTNALYALGGDMEVRREFAAGWMFAANYTYLFARYTNGGGSVANVPAHAASVRGVAPLGGGFRVALRTTLEAPRRLPDHVDRFTDPAVISDLVLSGEAPRYGLEYALGLYNLFDWRLALPTDPTFVTTTMPQPGRSLLASLSLRI